MDEIYKMEEVIKCDECGEIFENKKIKANHVRWKHRDQSAWKKKMSNIMYQRILNLQQQ